MRTRRTTFLAFALGAALAATGAPAAQSAPSTDDWLSTSGNQIVDSTGNPVWLTGVNWFGFNASERVFHGLWSANLETLTRQVAERGMNVIRVPVSTELLLEWRAGTPLENPNINEFANPDLAGMNNLEIFNHWLDLCEKYGLKVIIDVHSAEADNSGHVYNMWYKGDITTGDALNAWEWVAETYKNNDTIIGADLKNEPHGSQGDAERAKWDSSTDHDNFKFFAEQAADRILTHNPNMLILVEGIQIYPKDGVDWTSTGVNDYDNYWWGGNLRGVKDHPIDLGEHQAQLVYSPHDYGPLVASQPWFEGDWDRQSLEDEVWGPNWLYIHQDNIAPLLIGEWGGFLDGGPNEKWMNAIRDLIVDERLHHTFWVLNPNSGDTGGLLGYDWASWDEAKYDLLEPALWSHNGKFVSLDHDVPLGGANSTTGISLSDVSGDSPSDPDPDPTDEPTDEPTDDPTPDPDPDPTDEPTDEPSPGGSCTVAYTTNDWASGFTANLTITNTSDAPIQSWELAFDFSAGQTITNVWSANATSSGSSVTLTNAAWNGIIPPGGSVEIGFSGTHSGSNPVPNAMTINGTSCHIN